MVFDTQSSHQEYNSSKFHFLKGYMCHSYLRRHFTLQQNAAAAAHRKKKQLQRKAILVTNELHLTRFASTEYNGQMQNLEDT
jgi:hypothetical protein